MGDWYDNEPQVGNGYLVRNVGISQVDDDGARRHVWVQVDESGMISVAQHHGFFENEPKDSIEKHEQHKEIYEWMIEWELAKWQAIGPEDSEVFATKKLDKEYGLEG